MPRKPKDENDQLAKGIGEQITKAMERLNISLSELHKRTTISRTVLLAYTRGVYAPGARELKLLCEHLDVTPNVLLYGSNQVATTPYRLGDIALSEGGTQTIAFLILLSQLTQSEKQALLTLVEGLSSARNALKHRQLLATIDVMLRNEGMQEMLVTMTDAFVNQLPMDELEKEADAAMKNTK